MAKIDREISSMARTLKKLPEKIRKRVIASATRKGALVVVDKAQDIALSKFGGEGYMSGFIATRRGKSRRFEIVYKVGVEGGGRPSKHYPYYWRFLEFGTAKMAARPFLRPAGAMTIDKQISVLRFWVKRGVEREAKKLARS